MLSHQHATCDSQHFHSMAQCQPRLMRPWWPYPLAHTEFTVHCCACNGLVGSKVHSYLALSKTSGTALATVPSSDTHLIASCFLVGLCFGFVFTSYQLNKAKKS